MWVEKRSAKERGQAHELNRQGKTRSVRCVHVTCKQADKARARRVQETKSKERVSSVCEDAGTQGRVWREMRRERGGGGGGTLSAHTSGDETVEAHGEVGEGKHDAGLAVADALHVVRRVQVARHHQERHKLRGLFVGLLGGAHK